MMKRPTLSKLKSTTQSVREPKAGEAVVDFRLETLSAMDINTSISQFMRKTQSHFKVLKQFLKRQFVQRINRLEDKVEISDAYIEELLNLKSCLLEVQQRFFEMRQVHRD
mmetsp:Transcript_11173/g.18780  ORF Transcript_11173/g.18780 Transcript_11173/m.18780 type:complete len:110 (-) Transcript_11173:900-1229(-)